MPLLSRGCPSPLTILNLAEQGLARGEEEVTNSRIPGRCGRAERGRHSPATPAWQRAASAGLILVAFLAQQSQAGPSGAEECKAGRGGEGPALTAPVGNPNKPQCWKAQTAASAETL